MGSRVRSKILVAFFQAPGVERNAWVLAQELGENYSAVWKELGHLEAAGVLTSWQFSKARIYTVDPACPIISELRAIVMKTAGVGAYLRNKLAQMGNVKKVLIGADKAYERLIKQGRIQPYNAKPIEVNQLLEVANRDLFTAEKNQEEAPDWAYSIAYNAVLQASRALMLHTGFRPRGADQHATVVVL